MSDDSDFRNKSDQRRKRPLKAASSSESLDSGSPLAPAKNPRTELALSSNSSEDTDSDIDNDFLRTLRSQKKIVESEDGSSSSENEEIITGRPRRALQIQSDYESGESNAEEDDSSESSSEDEDVQKTKSGSDKTRLNYLNSDLSSDSDEQSERCPICLARFQAQEIGTPESCDHCFCVLCIQEWAKNVNTCPVDRQPFTLILIREHLEGKVVRQIPVSPPTETQEVPEDASFCEICGEGDREESMLLCDYCDQGYHMECLTPPLQHIPIEEWFCPECAPTHGRTRRTSVGEILHRQSEEEEEEETEAGRQQQQRQRPAPRLLPRTRQSERVRTTVRDQRRTRQLVADTAQPSTSSGVDLSPEGERRVVGERRQQARPRRRQRRRRRPTVRVKQIFTEDGIIEVRLKRKTKRKYQKKRKQRTLRAAPRSAKGRLASRLGMCAPRIPCQTIPESLNRQELSTAPINHQRHQAGVPTLDLFGRRDQLDYFSGSDGGMEEEAEEGGGLGGGLLSRAVMSHATDRLTRLKRAKDVLSSTSLRRPRKIEKIETAAPASSSLLDSILDSQTLWHSKKTQIKSKADGSLQVILPKQSKQEVLKEEKKMDVRTCTAPVVQAMYSAGREGSSGFHSESSSRGGSDHGNRGVDRTHQGGGQQTSAAGRSAGAASGDGSSSSGGGTFPLRSTAPIRFRMSVPPRRPNIHSYPSDNIPPPPPARLRSPNIESTFPITNSPENSPQREDEDVDIYSDIEQESNNETEEKSFGALEPPPEPPFLMSMEPPPEPPAMLMTINDDASDDEPSGLVIDDPPPGDVYDPCAVNSDDSSTQDTPLTKPPEIPMALQEKADLVADYSSDSATYNPEMPSYSRTPMIGPMPRPLSHASSEDEDECPNFSMYSAASMNLALRSLPTPLDIPVPPPVEQTIKETDNIPLPEGDSVPSTDQEDLDIPIPPEDEAKTQNEAKEDHEGAQESIQEDVENSEAGKESSAKAEEREEKHLSDSEEDGGEGDDEDEGDEDENNDAPEDQEEESEVDHSDVDDAEKTVKSTETKIKGSETAEDECSTQGDVLDLAIEAETNLENNLPQDENEQEMTLTKSPREAEEKGDGGEKSDGLVDITDEEMSEYDGQDNDLNKSNENISGSIQREENRKSGDSDDDNSLVGGATSAVSAGTLNNSDNVQPQPVTATLPGLEGLETETISESEDVNFDEPLEGSDLPEVVLSEEELSSSRKRKRKKYRKTSIAEDSSSKGNNEPLEFEEGEIIEDKPKQVTKKDKIKIKQKTETLIEGSENIDVSKAKTPPNEKESTEKKVKEKKKKDKSSLVKDKNKEPKEKTAKVGQVDENISWKKPSKSTKDRNYRDGKEEKDRDKDKDRDRENKSESSKKDKDKRSREKRKELERYDVRRLISEKPKQPRKDEFGRDISPSKSGSSLSPYRPPRYRSPLRTRNRSRTRSRSRKSRSRSRGRRRRSRSRDRVRSRDRSKRARSKIRARRSRSRNRGSSRSREKRKSIDKLDKSKTRSVSRSKRRSRSLSNYSKRQRSLSLSKSWTPSWSRSSLSRSRSPRRRHKTRSKSRSRSRSRSWVREQEVSRGPRVKDPPKNLTVIVTNKDALKKKDKKNTVKKKDERRKKRRGLTPAPSKEVFTSGDNILVSVNFKNANKMPEVIPGSTPLLRESSKRKRDDVDSTPKKKKQPSSSKKSPGAKKSSRLAKINEAARNAKPVAIIDLDLSPFREQTPSPKEVIVLSDSGDEVDKQRSEHNGKTQSMLSLSSIDQGQKNSMSQPESPLSSSFMLNSSGPKTPPEPHVKFSITTKPSQVRMLSNPLMDAEEEMQDENVEDVNEILHKGPNTPPEPPPDLNTPASPPTTPYDPFDPTKSRSVSPQPHSDTGSQQNTLREDKLDSMQGNNDNQTEMRVSTPPKDLEEVKMTPESGKVHSTPKADLTTDGSPKVPPPTGSTESNKLFEDSLMKPIQKLLSSANKLDVSVHKSPEKLITVVINQQVKSQNQTPKQVIQPKAGTPSKHQTPKSNTKHQLFSSSLLKQVPILGTLPLLSSGRQQNGDPSDDMDIDPSSPYSPGSSEAEDLFEPPAPALPSKPKPAASASSKFDSLFGSSPAKLRHGRHSSAIKSTKKGAKSKSSKGNKKEEIKVKLDEDQLKILDDLPSSAVEMQVKDKFLKKLNRQERVVEEVKLVLKPHYAKKHVTKEEYKEILRRSVPKICHNKSGEINPLKIQSLVEAYVKKFRWAKKKASGGLPSSQNKPKPQKTLWS